MPPIAPLLVELGVNASIVAGMVLAARVAVFAINFMRMAGIGPWRTK